MGERKTTIEGNVYIRVEREGGKDWLSPHFPFLTLINLPFGSICTSQNINNGVLLVLFEEKTKSSPI